MNNKYAPISGHPFNFDNSRNIGNTDKRYYNCGGYALGTFSWYWPGRTEEEHDEIMGYAENEDYDEALVIAADAIIAELPGWKIVLFEDVMKRMYSPLDYDIVAMRFCEFDFHFLKLGCNWNWYDKMGNSHRINRHGFQEMNNTSWYGRYDSPIVCFIRAR